jgi:hypothetical protein
MYNGHLETRFSPLTQVIHRRLLPLPGEVLVHVGDRVHAQDVVARAAGLGDIYSIDLARALNVSLGSVRRYLHVSEGQAVNAGVVVASARWAWIRYKRVRAPIAGIVVGIAEGRIFLRQEPQALQLRADVPGEIVDQYPHRGVAIRTTGALVRGIWGSGAGREGMLIMAAGTPDEALPWERVSFRYRGTIIVGGRVEDARVLYRASHFRLSGLVLGSLAPNLKPICESLGLPVVLTEGMGRVAMAQPIFDLLRSYHGRPAVVVGQGDDSGSAPEVIIPLQTKASAQIVPFEAMQPIQLGSRVRLTRSPYLGIVGQVIALPSMPQETWIGTWADGAEVRLPGGQKVFVPLVNMELFE